MPALAAVLDSLQFDGERLAEPTALGDLGLRRIASNEPTTSADGSRRDVSSISFVSTADPAQWINVTVGPALSTIDRAMRGFLLRQPVAMTIGTHVATFGLDGRIADHDQPIGLIDIDGVEVELTGGASTNELITLARSLRIGSADEWSALVEHSRATETAGPSLHELTIDDGVTRSGGRWHASVEVGADQPEPVLGVTFSGTTDDHGQDSVSYTVSSALADDAAVIQPNASATGVVLIARVGAAHVGAELRVVVADASYHATVASPGTETSALFAAVGFSELASYHAQLVDADGTVLATLDDT